MKQGDIPYASPSLSNADDHRHKLADPNLSRESLFFEASLVEDGIGVLAYAWVDGNGVAGAIGRVFADNDERLAEFSVQDVVVSPSADFDNWQVGPLTIKHEDPHRVARVTFSTADCHFDGRFEGIAPAFGYQDSPGGCPSFFADNRLEQTGRFVGTLTLGGKVIPFNAPAHRDHSWGTRDWTAFHHYKWVCVQTEAGVAINFTHALALDRQFEMGYLTLDGIQAPIISIQADVERDARFYAYTSAELVIKDELGRTTEVKCMARKSLVSYPAGGLILYDAVAPCIANGSAGVVYFQEGWMPEFIERRKASMPEHADTELGRQFFASNKIVGSAAL